MEPLAAGPLDIKDYVMFTSLHLFISIFAWLGTLEDG